MKNLINNGTVGIQMLRKAKTLFFHILISKINIKLN